jgi:hypothetical protein
MHAKTGMQYNGDIFETQRVSVLNKTGAALVVGGVYALDLSQSVAATSGDSLTFLVAVSANNINGVLVVAETAMAAGDSGLVVLSGRVKVRTNGTTALTDRLKATAAQNYLAAASSGVGSVDIGVGKPLAVNAGGPNLVDTLFDGVSFNKVVNGAVS